MNRTDDILYENSKPLWSIPLDGIKMEAENAKLRSRVAELEQELSDHENSFRMVMDEKCTEDQLHCTCVPILKKRITDLESDALKSALLSEKIIGKLRQELEEMRRERRLSCQEVEG